MGQILGDGNGRDVGAERVRILGRTTGEGDAMLGIQVDDSWFRKRNISSL